jgi:anti-sigma factor RsiW
MHPDDILLNEFVDRTLGPDEHAEVGRHLERCRPCRELVADLMELKTVARALGAAEPAPRVWRRIQEAVESDRRPTGTPWWSWLATAAALAIVVVAGERLSHRDGQPTADIAARGTVTVEAVESELRQAEAHYEHAIKGLEQIASTGQGALDLATAATLQKNLAVIDQAISESRAAVRAQPSSEPAQASLFEGFKTKIAFLQDTVALINQARRENGAGAAGIASRPRKG